MKPSKGSLRLAGGLKLDPDQKYLDLQSTQNNGLNLKGTGTWAIILGTLVFQADVQY